MKRVLIALMLAGAGYLLAPALRPNNARCLHCRRDLYAGSETYVVCLGCRHLIPASTTPQFFATPPGFPFLAMPTQAVRGPLPPNTIER